MGHNSIWPVPEQIAGRSGLHDWYDFVMVIIDVIKHGGHHRKEYE
jgi:hypothetical protein